MARFLATPSLPAVGKRNNGKTEYRASGPIMFQADDGITYSVPIGWRSDGVSWPTWLVWAIGAVGVAAVSCWLFGAPLWARVAVSAYFALWVALWLGLPTSKLLLASFVHDWACEEKRLFPNKATADSMFLQAMRALGVSVLYRWPMYEFVRRRPDRVEWQQPDLKPITDAAGEVDGWE